MNSYKSRRCFLNNVHFIARKQKIIMKLSFIISIMLTASTVIFALTSANASNNTSSPSRRKVLVIALDGFRADYYGNYTKQLTNLTQIVKNGVRAISVKPSFPTLTFPNHFTIATGVYPETHGIVHNSFWDPVLGKHFSLRQADEKFWHMAVEPIWITAERQGIKTAVFMWPGVFDVPFDGILASVHSPKYDGALSWQSRIDTALNCLSGGDGEVKLAMIYFHEPDATGHSVGPDQTDEIAREMGVINEQIGYLLHAIQDRGNLTDRLDLIICSDHGMSGVNKERVVFIDELFDTKKNPIETLLDKDKYNPFFSPNATSSDGKLYGTVVHLWPLPGKADFLYQQLVKSSQNASNKFSVYLKEETPLHWHYRNNRRISPIILVAKPGWQLATYREQFKKSPYLSKMNGLHGYDNTAKDMQAAFFAMGPSFRSNVTLQPFENVNIYSLIAHLTEVRRPQANNGTLAPFLPALKKITIANHNNNNNLKNNVSNEKTSDYYSSWNFVALSFCFILCGILIVLVLFIIVKIVVKNRGNYRQLLNNNSQPSASSPHQQQDQYDNENSAFQF